MKTTPKTIPFQCNTPNMEGGWGRLSKSPGLDSDDHPTHPPSGGRSLGIPVLQQMHDKVLRRPHQTLGRNAHSSVQIIKLWCPTERVVFFTCQKYFTNLWSPLSSPPPPRVGHTSFIQLCPQYTVPETPATREGTPAATIYPLETMAMSSYQTLQCLLLGQMHSSNGTLC